MSLVALLHNMLIPMANSKAEDSEWKMVSVQYGTHQCVPPGSVLGLVIFDVFINGLCVISEGEEFDGEAKE